MCIRDRSGPSSYNPPHVAQLIKILPHQLKWCPKHLGCHLNFNIRPHLSQKSGICTIACVKCKSLQTQPHRMTVGPVLRSVSYTHLDVYKRQAAGGVVNKSWINFRTHNGSTNSPRLKGRRRKRLADDSDQLAAKNEPAPQERHAMLPSLPRRRREREASLHNLA